MHRLKYSWPTRSPVDIDIGIWFESANPPHYRSAGGDCREERQLREGVASERDRGIFPDVASRGSDPREIRVIGPRKPHGLERPNVHAVGPRLTPHAGFPPRERAGIPGGSLATKRAIRG